MIRILGIDPGLKCTGWGVIESEENKLRFVDSGTISTKADQESAERIKTLHLAMQQVILSYKPEQVAIEETFVNKNARSSLKLGYARGALLLTVSLAGIKVAEYAPRLIKKTIVGNGNADKTQVKMMVNNLLPGANVESEDAADALAIAICHLNHGSLVG